MKITCPYCGNLFDNSNKQCPHCNAPNENPSTDTPSSTPSTIDQLRRWYQDRNLPPYEVTRFFIGQDVSEPRAFGIYRQGEKVIVYKNKDSGQRAVRYQGTDEGYAVSEFFAKLQEEVLHQKQVNFRKDAVIPGTPVDLDAEGQAPAPNGGKPPAKRRGCLTVLLVIIILMVLTSLLGRGKESTAPSPAPGYYSYNGETYYHQNDKAGWYSYDNGVWSVAQNLPSSFYNNVDDYYDGYSYSSDYSSGYYSDFSDTSYYDDYNSSSSSSSSSSWSTWDDEDDWDWDSGDSWDSSSSSSDWDSDW